MRLPWLSTQLLLAGLAMVEEPVVGKVEKLEFPSLSSLTSTGAVVVVEEPDLTKEEKKLSQKKQSGGYKTKERIEKAPLDDHPCNLTRTSVRISFPELKDELFVNFLGYREPNLVYLWRCKGVCGLSHSPVACAATKITEKKLTMRFKVKVTLSTLDVYISCITNISRPT